MVALSCFSEGSEGHSQSKGSIECIIDLLDDSSYRLKVKKSCKAESLMNEVCKYLNISESDYFGLRLLDDTKTSHWLDLQKSLMKEIKRYGLTSPAKFYFGVKFYATDPCKLKEEITRYQFFLQLKRDVLDGRIPLPFDLLVDLCSLVVQSELGDYNPTTHTPGYVSELRLAPQQSEELEHAIATHHQKLIGFHPSACEYMYLDKIKWQDMYGVDLHLVKGAEDIEYYVGPTPSGVVIYRQKYKVTLYFWPRIVGITFKGKRLALRVPDKNGRETTYYFTFDNKESCKSFWKCCIEHHTFFRLSQADTSTNVLTNFFHFGSKFRYSGRTEKELALSQPERTSQTVTRTKSQRQERRRVKANPVTIPQPSISPQASIASAVPAATPNTPFYNVPMESTPTAPPPFDSVLDLPVVSSQRPNTQPMDQVLDSNSGNYRPTNQLDLSWIAHGGLFTSGKESPKSVRSDKMKFPKLARNDSGSEADSLYTRRSKRAESPVDSRSAHFYTGGHNKRESDSESERSGVSRRRRRRYHRGYDSASDGESVSHRRRRQRYNGSFTEESVCSEQTTPRSEATYNKSKYGDSLRRQSKGLAQHLNFNLTDTNGLTREQLKDIAYTTVKVDAQTDNGRLSPSQTYEKTTPHPDGVARARRLSSCSYENILYDKSGSAHIISNDVKSASPHQTSSSDYAVIPPPPSHQLPSSQLGNDEELSPLRTKMDSRSAGEDLISRIINSNYSWAEPSVVYKHSVPPARVVNTRQAVDKLYSANENGHLRNSKPKTASAEKSEYVSMDGNNKSFYSSYANHRNGIAGAHKTSNVTNAPSLKVSNI